MAGTISVPAPSSIRTGGTLKFRHIFALPILLVAFACSTEPAEETGTMTETEDTAVATDTEARRNNYPNFPLRVAGGAGSSAVRSLFAR